MITFQRIRSVGLMTLSLSMVLLSDVIVAGAAAVSTDCMLAEAVGDGVCDMLNNNAECGASSGWLCFLFWFSRHDRGDHACYHRDGLYSPDSPWLTRLVG